MKKLLTISIAALGLALAGCSDDAKYDLGNGSGEGRVMIRTSLNADVTKSRAITSVDDLKKDAMIWISNEKGLVRRFDASNPLPAGGVTLLAGNYTAEVWAGDSVPASFDTRWFKGAEKFTVGDGSVSQVTIVAALANVVSSVVVEDGAKEVLSDISMTVGHKTGSLEFTPELIADGNTKGYFMMPSIDKNLTWTLNGTLSTGEEFTKTGTIENAKPKTEYILTVKHDGGVTTPVGGAFITVEVQEATVVEDEYTINAAPAISGIGFDLSQAVIAEPGKFAKKSLWIAATSFLKKVELRCDAFTDLLGIGGNDFEIFGMDPSLETVINEHGLRWTYTTHDDTNFSEMKISFDKELLNNLPSGEHAVTVIVTDNADKTATATLNIMVSDALVMTDQVEANAATTWATKATLTGTVMKENATGFGIQYRKQGTQQWTQVAADGATSRAAVNSKYTVTLTGLEPGTTYEYQSYCDDFTSSVTCTFTTESNQQLPNSSFEEWSKDGKSVIPAASKESLFWDTGNKGSSTLNKQVTEQETTLFHSGKSSARLTSQYVAMFGIGKFAAGNIFIGEFLGTEETYYGILAWGRPFASRPRALRAWVKYTPVAINRKDSGDPRTDVKVGDMDSGIIYIAILNGENKNDAKLGTKYPCVVRTLGPSLFSKNDKNVIGYGERVFKEATAGDGLIEVEIPISYEGYPEVKAENIICVASSSIGGDYYTGGEGSQMIIDDFELLY